ncbi:hypothetical protein Angca_007843, partial [Angiostrongylus cantonensis]
GLYLNEYQPNPYSPCFKNDCHPKGICIDVSERTYRCECSPGFRELNPSDPGKRCIPTFGFNECEKKENNECSENARCVDLEHLYKCECLPSYSDASPLGAVPGSVCVLDYCSDVNFCPTNTTCKNMEQQAECRCDPGFTDIRKSDRRTMLGLGDDTLCMHVRDVNECALGLTNCSGVAECIDRPIGYTCKCPEGYIDGNPDEPGRVCGALLCDLCNSHGDCVHNAQTNNITCICTEGWSGEYCQVAPSNASLVLLILLALLFLLLTLCCLLYFCTKCRCFKGSGIVGGAPFVYRRGGAWPWSTLEGSSSSESGAEFSAHSAAGHEYYPDIGIPRAKLKVGAGVMDTNKNVDLSRMEHYLCDGVVRIPRAHLVGGGGRLNDSSDSMSDGSSEYTIKEEIERKVITDVVTKEIKTTTTTDNAGNVVTATRSSFIGESSYATRNSECSHDAAFSERQFHHHSGLEERERGESVAEFSIGRAKSKEYSTRDREIAHCSSQDATQSDFEEHEIGGAITRVTNFRHYEPIKNGESERFRSEVVTSQTSTTVNKY